MSFPSDAALRQALSDLIALEPQALTEAERRGVLRNLSDAASSGRCRGFRNGPVIAMVRSDPIRISISGRNHGGEHTGGPVRGATERSV